MKKLKEARPAIFWTSVMIGVALLAVYSFASDFIIIGEDSANQSRRIADFSSGSSATDGGSDRDEEENGKLFSGEEANLYATSRGTADRKEIKPLEKEEITASEKEEGQQTAGKSAEAAGKTFGAAAPEQSEAVQPKSVQTESSQSAQVEPMKGSQPEPTKTVQLESAKTVQPKPTETAQAAPAKIGAETQNSDDLDLLARLITAEAQGEPYEAKVAVGAVVMNRVQSSSWPDTIRDVIYQEISGYHQFTPVENGWIDKPAEAESVKAAIAALKGADPTGGAEFYYDDSTTNAWILGKPISVQIGSMIYAF